MEFYKGTPGEVPEKFRNRQFRRSADDNSRLNYGEKFYARAIMNDKLEHLIFSGQVRPEGRVKKIKKKNRINPKQAPRVENKNECSPKNSLWGPMGKNSRATYV